MRLLGCLGKTGPWVSGRIWKESVWPSPIHFHQCSQLQVDYLGNRVCTLKNEWLVPWSLFGYCMILSLHGGFQVAWILQSFAVGCMYPGQRFQMILSANGFFPCFFGRSLQNAPFKELLVTAWGGEVSFMTPEIQWLRYRAAPSVEVPTWAIEIGGKMMEVS